VGKGDDVARFLIAVVLMWVISAGASPQIRLKDLGRFSAWRENSLVGFGLVTGLAGTGDSVSSKATRQAIANMLGRFDSVVPADQISTRNAALVMVTGTLPPFAVPGNSLDVTVTSLGDARSLTGGALLLTPLKGPDGRTYALAQGALSVGGYKYDMNGNVVQKNHPTVGSVPNGAIVEAAVRMDASAATAAELTFLLDIADHTTATRIAAAIESYDVQTTAVPRNAGAVSVKIPERHQAKVVDFIAKLENLTVEPDERARVVINERTGTVVSGGDVRIDKVVISQGDLKISIATETTVAQPRLIVNPGSDIRTAVVGNTTVDAKEGNESGIVVSGHTTASDLIRALSKIKMTTRDIISVLRAVKAAGAMHADLVIQ